MRLLRLSLEPGEGAAVELHPMLSVVQGLDDRARERLVRTVTAVAEGTEPPCAGLAEAHGVLVPLDEAHLSVLDLHTDADPVVRRRDLPGSLPGPGDDARPGDDDEVEDPVATLLRTAPEGLHPALDEARRHHDDTREALRVLREAAETTARALAEAADERRRISDAIGAAAVAAEHGDDPGPAGEVAALERELAALDAGIAELSALDLDPVRVLLEAIEDPAPVDRVPSPEAQAMADEFVRLHGEVVRLEERMEAEGRGPDSALRRLDAARAEAVAAEASLTRPPVSGDDEEALRRAHDDVLDAERKASGLRSRSGQRKLAQALARQQEILDRVGFPTWSAYVMGASIMGVDEEAKERLRAAEAELAAAEEAWAGISAALEADPEHHALLDRLEELEVQAIGLLLQHGVPVPDEREDLEPALRALRRPGGPDPVAELTATLAHQLEGLGLHVEPTDGERVLAAARALLEEFAGVPERLEELANDRRRLEARLVDARNRTEAWAWEALEAAVEQPPSDRMAGLEDALSAARDAEEQLAEQMEARQALVDAAGLAERAAARRLRTVAAEVVEQSGPVAGADGQLWSETDAEAIELYLLARLAALRHVSYAGSVPLVLDDVFHGLPEDVVHRLLGSLARMTESVQVVVLGDDALVAAWAHEQGPDVASVVSVAPAFA